MFSGPEFDTITILVLATAIISIIMIYVKSRFSIMSKRQINHSFLISKEHGVTLLILNTDGVKSSTENKKMKCRGYF
jgi:hypothetical protein